MNAENRMTEGSIPGKMLAFTGPIFLGNLFQQLYNTADTLIVGNMLGDTALAAVSSTGSVTFMLVSLFSGISVGAGVVISRYFGAEDRTNMRRAIHTDLTFGFFAGILLTLVGMLLSPWILVWMKTPAEVFPETLSYLQMYFLGGIGLVLYNTCTGIMQAVGDSKHPLEYLVISSCLNVVLDLFLIGILGMGVEGAGLATAISQILSTLLCLRRLLRVETDCRVSLRELGIDFSMLKKLLYCGIPAGLQNSIISIANIVVQSNINIFGEMAMAGCGAYSKIEGFVFLPINSFILSISTFVGQNLGAKKYDRVQKGARFGGLCSVLMAESIGIIFYLTAPTLIRAFTDTPEAIAFGVQRAHICTLFYCLLALTHSLSAVLRGAGKAIVPMVIMISYWTFLRILILAVAVPIFKTIAVVSWVYPITWSLSSVTLLIYYFKANWMQR